MTVSRPRQNTPRLRPPSPRRGFIRRTASSIPNPILSRGATAWYDSLNGLSGQTWTALASGQVATLGSTAGVDTNDPTIVSNGVTFDGTDDYVQCAGDTPSYGASGLYTVLICTTSTPGASSPNTQYVFSTGASGTGLNILNYLGGLYVRSGTSSGGAVIGGVFAAGVRTVVGMTADNGTILAYARGSALTPPISGTPTHSTPRFGMIRTSVGVGAAWDGTIHGVAIFDGAALSQSDCDTVADYMHTRYA